MTEQYGFNKQVTGSFEQVIENVTAALKGQGFGVLTTIDIQTTFKKKLDVDMGRYMILGACNPKLAYSALQTDVEIGLLLPCNVIVYENDDAAVTVSIVDPEIMLGVVDVPALKAVALEAKTKLENALSALD
ncbi:MAG TPA: DUF302 domain-containing protein [Anaerolineae bacterium]|nr:DUF302 domain-containing protein [Anaerolineae bacterium]